MKLLSSVAIIIPAFNEEMVIEETIKTVRKFCKTLKYSPIDVIVVDDGSSDNTRKIATKSADYVVFHRRNCGLGASLATGIEFAKRTGYEYCITFDADGQHDPRDIGKALKKLKEGYDVVVGSRFLGTSSDMPRNRQLILKASNLVTWIFFAVRATDSQSGFRGLSKQAIDAIRLKSNRMEVSSEFFGEIRRLRLKFTEIPIHIRYTPYSLKKGQKNTHSIGVFIKLIYKLFS